jgi:hypothetical protein
MACEGATGNICTGIVTGACAVAKALTTLEDLVITGAVISGTTFTISWDTSTSLPDQIIRSHIRSASTVSGYVAADIDIVARDIGSLSFQVVIGQEYYIWLRAETDTEHTLWYYGVFLAEDGTLEVPNLVLWQGAIVTYGGEQVVYRSDTEANFLNIYVLEV